MELEKTTKVPVERLRLDRRNPRLIGADEQASDEAIIARLYRSAGLDELLQSISANGYMDIEPLVVMSDPDAANCGATVPEGNNTVSGTLTVTGPGVANGDLTVLEGNRRLAALRLLREPDLVRGITASERLRISIPPIAAPLRATLDEVSVYPVASRERARSFIGFKHINGPTKWDAYAKARFAAEWYKTGRAEGVDLTVIANAIGDKHDTIKRMVSAIYVLEQAKNEGLFDVEDRHTRRLNFSHLYTALSRSQYMDYLGLGAAWVRHDPEPDQVPREKLGELRNVLVWIYGSKKDDVRPVVRSQNPDIKRLGEVIAHTQARHMLETKGNLDEAHASTEPVGTQFTRSLIGAREHIGEAARSLRAYDGRDQSLLDIAEDVRETAQMVYERMGKKRREASDAE